MFFFKQQNFIIFLNQNKKIKKLNISINVLSNMFKMNIKWFLNNNNKFRPSHAQYYFNYCQQLSLTLIVLPPVSIIYSMSFIGSPSKFLNSYASDPDVVMNSTLISHCNTKLKIMDFCVRGLRRQSTYALNPDLHLNVRNACTLIETEDQILWGRKSLPYVFEYRLQYLNDTHDKQSRLIRESLFGKVKQTLLKKNKVEIIKTELIDGLNVEVTFIPQIESWNIASCNCSLVVSSRKEIEQYQSQFKKTNPIFQISEEWFNQIERLKPSHLKQLKLLLTDHTLVGSLITHNYIINHKKQTDTLKKNRSNTFIWNARINHYSNTACLDILETKKLLNRLGFDFVRTKTMVIATTYGEFIKQLQSLAVRVFESPLHEKEYGGMGSTVYFIQHRNKGNNIQMQVIGSTNVLSLQYQIYDHISYIFGSLSSYENDKHDQANKVDEFQCEWEEKLWVYKCFPDLPLKHYVNILTKGIEVIKEHKLSQKQINDNFQQLISCLLYCWKKKLSFRPEMVINHMFTKYLKGTDFSTFGPIGCKQVTVYASLTISNSDNVNRLLKKKLEEQKYKILLINKFDINDENLFDKIAIFLEDESLDNRYFIYVDADFKFEQLQRFIQKIKNTKDYSHYYKYIMLNPNQQNMVIKDDQYPFSFQNLLSFLKNHARKNKNFESFCQSLQIIKSYKNVLPNEQLKQTIEHKYQLTKCRITGGQNFLRDKVINLLTEFEPQQDTYSQIMAMMQNVRIEYVNDQKIQNQLEEIVKVGSKKIPTFYFE